ncbi:hypothetical protein [Helicobacter enhydrae]|nr:hypothetical protein [Helicobacter enhydrae]
MARDVELYLGGGKLFMQKLGGVEKVDMGVQTLSLSRESATKEAFSRAYGTKQRIEEVIVDDSFSLKGTINNMSAKILEFALGSNVESVEIADGEKLPNGETNSSGKTIVFSKLKAGSSPTFKAKLIFEGVPVSGKQSMFVAYEANIKLSGELNLVSDDFAEVGFEAKLNKTSEGIYDHYIKEEEKQ